jgi:ATP-binding cassette subfamily B protein
MVLISSINKIWSYLNQKRRQQLFFLLTLMIVTSIAEVISIGAVVPFLGALSNSEIIFNHYAIKPFAEFFEISSHQELLLPIIVIFIIAVIFAGSMRIILLWVQNRVAHGIGSDLGFDSYQSILMQPYEEHVTRNSSEIVAAISIKINQVVAQTIKPIMIIISSFLIFIVMVSFLIFLNPVLAFSSLTGFAGIYLIVILFTKGPLLRNSKIINTKTSLVVKYLQEGLGGIRNVILENLQDLYAKSFRHEDIKLRRAIANNQIISQSPRFGVESLGMVLIAILAYKMGINEGDFSNVIPVLGAFALGAQRILPLIQQSYQGWSSVYGSQVTLNEVMSYLSEEGFNSEEIDLKETIKFKKSIKLNNLSFQYKGSSDIVLKGINVEIIKGSRIGFIGETGSGKSTLLDIIMCLLHPNKGSIDIDEVIIDKENSSQWQKNIAHIPQNIFLLDDTITRNIAFGIPENKVDHERVVNVAKKAGILKTIEALDEKFESKVGERGAKLSGGQRQRIAIARALYKKSNLIILDEATSALDEKTEESVMNEIYKIDKNITIIIVSHRTSTLKNCDLIYEISKGEINWSGNYFDLKKRNI